VRRAARAVTTRPQPAGHTSYDELIGALCVDAYNSAASALAAARDAEPADDHAGRWTAICHGYRRWSLDNPGDFALIFGTPAPGYQAPESLTGPAAARFAAVPLGVYAAAAREGAAAPDCTQVPDTLAAGRLMQDLADEGGAVLPPRLAGVALNAWASVLGFLTLEIFGSLTRLITDTDELYRAHVHTVMLGMGYDPDLTSTAAARGAVRFDAHGV
jgi:Tetracyclin repressor-like, C-terminal domain